MCGFVSIIAHQVDERILRGMRDMLRHRGPDSEGLWIGTTREGWKIGLSHRRLKILDLSENGAQPMWDDDRLCAIVFNGEIYNFKELRRSLQEKGYTFRSHSDTEVLLKAYIAYGLDFIHHLNGMFACTIWDERKQELIVIRDRFGEKPLYYGYLPKGGVIFASEIKAIVAHPQWNVRIHEAMLDAFLKGAMPYESDETYLRNIFKVPPSHLMIFNGKGELTFKKRYWEPPVYAEKTVWSQEDSEEFLYLLQKSVKDRFQADVPVGTCLSGGLDSSLITCIAYQTRHTKPFAAISARFPKDQTLDEGPYIDAVLHHCKGTGLFVTPSPLELVETMDDLHWHQEEPFLSASMYLEWCVQKKAKASGITVMLDGQGADEILGGYQHYFQSFQLDLLSEKKYASLLKETYLFNRHLHKASILYSNPSRRFNKNIAYSFSFLAKQHWNRLPFFENGVFNSKDIGLFRYRVLHGLLYDMLPSQLHSADRNGMAHSMETRFPFLDYPLVDFCLNLPRDALIRRGWQKYILRQSTKHILPKSIQWRADKVGFAAPLDLWLREDLKKWGHDLLQQPDVKHMASGHNISLEHVWKKHQKGEDHSWEIWKWISASYWKNIKWTKAID